GVGKSQHGRARAFDAAVAGPPRTPAVLIAHQADERLVAPGNRRCLVARAVVHDDDLEGILDGLGAQAVQHAGDRWGSVAGGDDHTDCGVFHGFSLWRCSVSGRFGPLPFDLAMKGYGTSSWITTKLAQPVS